MPGNQFDRFYANWTPEQNLKRITDDLSTAREVIFHMLPHEMQGILRSYTDCKTRKEALVWNCRVIRQIAESPYLIFDRKHGEERAYCPLCGRGTQNGKGFMLPEGLERHLEGHGNTTKCPVFHEIWHLAWEYWDDKFLEDDKMEMQEQSQKWSNKVERMKTETLYLTRLDSFPMLRDDVVTYNQRDDEQLYWAKIRLFNLGFSEMVNQIGKQDIISWVYPTDNVWVFANPFRKGGISFFAYNLPLPALEKHKTSKGHQYLSAWELPDQWVNRLSEKFAEFLTRIGAKQTQKVIPDSSFLDMAFGTTAKT